MDYKEESTRLAGHKDTRGCMTGCDYMDTHCVQTGEDALLLYIDPKGELQEKQRWEDGGERHFVPHKCSSYLQKKHICVLWW
jgi:hypothetical protein